MLPRPTRSETRQVSNALIPSQREQIYRRNFVFFLGDNILFNVGLGIIGSTTVIPDFVRHLTHSEILIGLCGGLFTIGNTFPQLFIARQVVRHAHKKWWFVGPNIPARFVVLIFALLTLWMGKDHLDLVLPAFFIAWGVAAFGDGLVGVPWADLAGTSLSNHWRARMFGFTTAVTGVVMLLIAPLVAIMLGVTGPGFPSNYAILFAASGTLFALSILAGLFFHELPGGKPRDTVPPFREFIPDLVRMLRADVPFRAFIVLRILTSLFLMAAPFYIGYATVDLGLSSNVAVPVLLAMQTIGSVAGALLMAWLGARNNILYMRLALVAAVLLPVCALLSEILGPIPLYAGFLLAGLATGSNLLSGYLNWIVAYAKPDNRPIYVGLANTVAAVVSLIAPFIGGTIAQSVGYPPLFAVSLVMAVCALFVTLRFVRNPRKEEPHAIAASST